MPGYIDRSTSESLYESYGGGRTNQAVVSAGGFKLAQWSAVNDASTCDFCGWADERIFEINAVPWDPPVHWGCRCLIAYISSKEVSPQTTWGDGPPKSSFPPGSTRKPPKPRRPKSSGPATEVRTEYLSNSEMAKARAEVAKALGISEDELMVRWQAVLGDSEVMVNVPNDVLSQILREGKLKNQFESGRGVAGSDLFQAEKRIVNERRLFGIADDAAAGDRPIYGWIGDSGRVSGADGYGNARIVLKTSRRNDVTVTFGDSAASASNAKMIPNPLSNVSDSAVDWIGIKANPAQFLEANPNIWHPYIETQIHGGVSLDDIAQIVFSKTPPSELVAVLDQAGIPWSLTNDAQLLLDILG